jgi:hypothetical protein
MENFENFENHDEYINESNFEPTVKPDATVIKFRDGSYHCIRFEIKDDNVVGYETEIDVDGVWENETLATLDYNQIAFVKINYEFEYDENQGVLEMQMGECVTLTDLDDEFVYLEDIYNNDPKDIISIYIGIIDDMM